LGGETVDIPAIVDLALQVDRLEALPRIGYVMRGVGRPESVAAHVYGVVFWTMILADHVAGVDANKAMRMAILHELGEVKLGDVPKIAEAYLPPGAKDSAEGKIVAELVAQLGATGKNYLELFHDFQQLRSLEARVVAAADKLQMMLKVLRYEMDGHRGVAGFWNFEPNFRDQDLPQVRALFSEIRRRRPNSGIEAGVEP